jgi:RNA polymerase sigma-70 factor (ECF subfamily)
MERLHAGDRVALNELIAHFERRLRSMTRRMIKDYPLVRLCEQTDDVYQNAVLRLCRALKAVSPASTRDLIRLSAVQVRRELLNLARFYRARAEILHQAEALAGASAGDSKQAGGRATLEPACPEGGDDVLLMDQWTEFHEAAAALPEPRRESFDLIWYQGLTFEQAARIQEVTPRTVRNRWNAARLAIYDALGGSLPGT